MTSDYHVDHIFNRERARQNSLRYTRMALIRQRPNTSHGAGYESGRTQAGLGKRREGVNIDVVMLMKLFGYSSPPRSGKVTAEMRHYADRVAPMLETTSEDIVKSIVRLAKDVAGFRPA